MLGDGQGTSCKATSPQLVRVLLLRPSPPHHPLLAFLRTDAFLTDDQPTTRQSTSTDHPPTCQPRGEDGAALCSAAPLALPCLLQRSPQPGPLGLAGCSLWLDSTQVLARPMATPARIWTGVGVELRGKWAPKGISVAWQDGSFFYDFFLGGGCYTFVFIFKDCAFIQSSWKALLLAPCASQSTLYAAGWLFWKIALIFLPKK